MRPFPVFLISGWAHGVEEMRPVAQVLELTALGRTHRVRSFSLAGLLREGLNAAPTEAGDGSDSAMSPYARAIAGHAAKAGEPVCLIGWSTGALVALEAAARLQDEISGLVLLSATARFCSSEDYAPGTSPTALRAMCRGLKRNPEAVLFDFFSRACHPRVIPEEELARRCANALRSGADALIQGLEYLQRSDLREALGAITRPCLVIHGQEDQIIPRAAAEYLGHRLVHATSVFLPDAGHMIIEQCEDDVTRQIREFMENLP